MRASFRWLQELVEIEADAVEVADRLTQAGLEIEALERWGEGLEGVVIAEVRSQRPHPKRDKLTLVTLVDGEGEYEVVCGATNVPQAGGKVLFARPGSVLPNGMKIDVRALGGIESAGMICSEVELDLGADEDGIVVVESTHPSRPGDPIVEALDLRDVVFEIGVTPNRPDCLGHIGIAREIALLYGNRHSPVVAGGPPAVFSADRVFANEDPTVELSAQWPGKYQSVPPPKLTEISVRIMDGERCPRYGAALVHGVTVRPSPFWLRYRLHLMGLRPVSNVVDATNWVLLEWGHPIHGFDLHRLRDSTVVVRLAEEGERMATLDGVERSFTADDLLICDGKGPVAVAGVMGGAESEIREDTTEVLIECAYFDPRSIRRTSRRLGLHTDSSHRFERGVDPLAVPSVLARAASMIAALGGGAAARTAIDRVASSYSPRTIPFRSVRASRLLGAEVEADESKRILEAVGCTVTSGQNGSLQARAPSWRPDLSREVDLIEEVARVRGYGQIPTAVPRVHPSWTGTPERLVFADRLRAAAAGAGLYEAVSFGFLSLDDLQRLRVPTDTVVLANPLSEERSVMRTSLLPGLVAAVTHAQRRGASEIKLFELGRTFAPSNGALPTETSTLALLLAGEREGWIGKPRAFDFYDGKGAIQTILDRLGKLVLSFRPGHPRPFLHPKRSALVELAGAEIGFVGELHPEVIDEVGLNGRAIYAELDVASLFAAAQAQGVPQARELPRYPAVARDIAMMVSEEFSAGEIALALQDASAGLAESVRLFDLYRGDQVPDGQRSLAFRVTYRDPENTLTDKRVDKAHAKLGEIARKRFKATIR